MSTAPITIRRAFIVPLAGTLLTLGACSSPTVVEDDHFDVEGFALSEDGVEIYRYMLDDGVPPSLTLSAGVHEVVFVPLDHDGNPLPEEEGEHDDEEHELRITISDTSILTWMPEDHHHEGEEFIVFAGELTALQEGTTSMEVCVPHEAHCDFDADVPVTVTGS